MICKFLKKLSNKIVIYFILFGFCCSGCGYHSVEQSNVLSRYKTIEVPYVVGDREGELTTQIVRSIVENGVLEYRTVDADLSLKVSIIDTKVEDVGYNRFFSLSDQIQRWMVPNERRLSALAEVSVIDEATQKTVLGPAHISASVKFDFDPEFSEDNLVGFSLGQYNFVEDAERSAYFPLNQKLSKEIADYIINSW